MRSLFHFPFPAHNHPRSNRLLQQPSHCSQKCAIARILHPCAAPQRCFPPPARSQGARHAAPPSLPRAAARSHRAPSPEYRPAAPAPIGLASSASRPSRAVARIASTPLRAAIRIPYVATEQIPHSSPPITTIVRRRRLTRVALRRPHRAHRAPTSASPPPHLSPRVAAAPRS